MVLNEQTSLTIDGIKHNLGCTVRKPLYEQSPCFASSHDACQFYRNFTASPILPTVISVVLFFGFCGITSFSVILGGLARYSSSITGMVVFLVTFLDGLALLALGYW
jgi:hypothetical protein